MLAPAKTAALALEVVEQLAEHTVFEVELSIVGNGGFSLKRLFIFLADANSSCRPRVSDICH